MKIGALAKLSGIKAVTIRYYEREGLLPPPVRTECNYRHYRKEDRHRLAFIRHCRTLGMSLAEVRLLLNFKERPDGDCEDVDALVREHIDETSRRIAELKQLRIDLEQLRSLCSRGRSPRECGIIEGIARAA